MVPSHGLVCYLLVTFGVTWVVAAGIFLAGGTRNLSTFTAGGAVVMLIPAAAAVFVRLRFREGFQDAGLRVGKWRYYTLTFGLLALWAAVAFGLTWNTPLGRFDAGMPYLRAHLPADKAAQASQPLSPGRPLFWLVLFLGPFMNLPFALGEELGWRGHLLVRLLPMGNLRAVLWTGVIWGLWHAPFILMGHNYPGYEVVGVLLMVVFCIALGWVLAWLFLRSGSVFVPALGHGAFNCFAYTLTVVTADFNPVLGGAMGVVSMTIITCIAGVLWFGFAPDMATSSGGMK